MIAPLPHAPSALHIVQRLFIEPARLACLWLLFLTFCPAAQGQGPVFHTRVEDVLKDYLKANGGIDNVKSIVSIQLTGEIQETGGDRYEIVLVKRRPNLKRLTLRYQGMIITFGYDGQETWRTLHKNKEDKWLPMSANEVSNFLEDIDFDGPLLNPEAKGIKIVLDGMETIGRSECYRLCLDYPNGVRQKILLDARTFWELRTVTERDVQGQLTTVVTDMSDYRKYQNIWLAMKIKRSENGQPVAETTITKAHFNAGILPTVFTRPTGISEP